MGAQRPTLGNTIGSLASVGNGEDRSDTWSVDAVASDSEADPVQRNYDLLMIDDPDGADVSSGLHFLVFEQFMLQLAILSIGFIGKFFGKMAKISLLNRVFCHCI